MLQNFGLLSVLCLYVYIKLLLEFIFIIYMLYWFWIESSKRNFMQSRSNIKFLQILYFILTISKIQFRISNLLSVADSHIYNLNCFLSKEKQILCLWFWACGWNNIHFYEKKLSIRFTSVYAKFRNILERTDSLCIVCVCLFTCKLIYSRNSFIRHSINQRRQY